MVVTRRNEENSADLFDDFAREVRLDANIEAVSIDRLHQYHFWFGLRVRCLAGSAPASAEKGIARPTHDCCPLLFQPHQAVRDWILWTKTHAIPPQKDTDAETITAGKVAEGA